MSQDLPLIISPAMKMLPSVFPNIQKLPQRGALQLITTAGTVAKKFMITKVQRSQDSCVVKLNVIPKATSTTQGISRSVPPHRMIFLRSMAPPLSSSSIRALNDKPLLEHVKNTHSRAPIPSRSLLSFGLHCRVPDCKL